MNDKHLGCGCAPELHTLLQACLADLIAAAYAAGYEAGLYRNLDSYVPNDNDNQQRETD